jgi:TonB family protein
MKPRMPEGTGAPGHGGTEARGRHAFRAPVRPCPRALRLPCFCTCLVLAVACRSGNDRAPAAPVRENDVPVAVNSESPFQYPPDLYDQGIEGEVRLRLFVDSTGRVHPESTAVATTSGMPGLDSAAVRGAAQLQFAPAHRDGQPVGMAFYQPVIFRRIEGPKATPE